MKQAKHENDFLTADRWFKYCAASSELVKTKTIMSEAVSQQVIFHPSLTAGVASVRTIQPWGQRVLLHAVSC